MKAERGKIFAPYDALRGLYSELKKKERIVVPRAEISEDQLEYLNRFFGQIHEGDLIDVVRYEEDHYARVRGVIVSFSADKRAIDLECDDGAAETVPFTDIADARFL